MSRIFRIFPAFPKKATDRGIEVFFIEKPARVGPKNRKAMPAWEPSEVRPINPRDRCRFVTAISTLKRTLPWAVVIRAGECASKDDAEDGA
jgi:hypothetical protein